MEPTLLILMLFMCVPSSFCCSSEHQFETGDWSLPKLQKTRNLGDFWTLQTPRCVSKSVPCPQHPHPPRQSNGNRPYLDQTASADSPSPTCFHSRGRCLLCSTLRNRKGERSVRGWGWGWGWKGDKAVKWCTAVELPRVQGGERTTGEGPHIQDRGSAQRGEKPELLIRSQSSLYLCMYERTER